METETRIDLPKIGSLVAQRDFRARSDQLWPLLTSPTSASTALQPILLESRPGGHVIWRPALHSHEEMEGTVTLVEAPTRLQFSLRGHLSGGGPDQEVAIDLDQSGPQTTLSVHHSNIDLWSWSYTVSSWHQTLNDLADHLYGILTTNRWETLTTEYEVVVAGRVLAELEGAVAVGDAGLVEKLGQDFESVLHGPVPSPVLVRLSEYLRTAALHRSTAAWQFLFGIEMLCVSYGDTLLPEQRELLVPGLEDASVHCVAKDARYEAASLLGEQVASVESVRALSRILKSPNDDARGNVIHALGHIMNGKDVSPKAVEEAADVLEEIAGSDAPQRDRDFARAALQRNGWM
jgi:HEAT repeats